MKRAGNWSMIGILVSVAIIAVLVIVFAKGSSVFGGGSDSMPARKDGVGTTVIGRSKAAAEDVVCREHLRQVRMAIGMKGEDEKATTLQDLRLDSKFYNCPFGDAYTLNAEEQTVICPHPGHEKY